MPTAWLTNATKTLLLRRDHAQLEKKKKGAVLCCRGKELAPSQNNTPHLIRASPPLLIVELEPPQTQYQNLTAPPSLHARRSRTS